MDKENEVCDVDLENTGTSLVSPKNVAAFEERPVVQENVPPTIPTSPLHNYRRIQAGEDRAPT